MMPNSRKFQCFECGTTDSQVWKAFRNPSSVRSLRDCPQHYPGDCPQHYPGDCPEDYSQHYPQHYPGDCPEEYHCEKCYYKMSEICIDCGKEYRRWNIFSVDFDGRCKQCHNVETAIIEMEYEENQQNILGLLEEFRSKYKKYSNTVILNDEQFNILYNYFSKNLSAAIWTSTVLGLNEELFYGTHIMISHEQLEKLFSLLSTDYDQFVHALGPNVLLSHKAQEVNTDFKLYCAKRKEDIFNTWANKINNFTWNVGKFKISDCPICLDGILSSDKRMTCTKCGNHSHFECKLRALRKNRRCEMCRYQYMDPNDIKIMSIVNSGTHSGYHHRRRVWTWMDYIG